MQIPFKKAESFHCYREITMISHNLWWTCEKRYNKALFSLLWQQRPSWNGVAICMEAANYLELWASNTLFHPDHWIVHPMYKYSLSVLREQNLTHADAIL